MKDLLKIHEVIGLAHENPFVEPLNTLAHKGAVETIRLSSEDMHRRRLRATTDQGTECAIAIPRSQKLCDGAILWIDPKRVVVIRAQESFWFLFEPEDSSAALELGYLAGNMHWQVDLKEGMMRVGISGNQEIILNRMAPLLNSGKVKRIGNN